MMQRASKRQLGDSKDRRRVLPMQPRLDDPSSEKLKDGDAPIKSQAETAKELEIMIDQHEKAIPGARRQPRTAGGSIVRRRQKQVDFYRNPTILSRLALNQKYLEAKSRLRRFPQEASTWVAAKRTQKSGYSIRQLPLHICCLNLKRALDPTTRQLLNDLIVSLIVAHPDACRMMDHLTVLPVHMALWYGAAPEVISMCFMAYPESINLLDKRGRSCTELLKGSRVDSQERQKLESLLLLRVPFWRRAQTAAKKRLAEAEIPWDSSSAATSDDRVMPRSMSSETEATETTESSTGYGMGDEDEDDDDIEPMAWEQLESRAMALEQVLNEVNEKNFELTQRIQQLSKTKTELQQKLETQKTEFGTQVASLQSENAKLKTRLQEVERELAEARRHQLLPSASASTLRKDNTSAMHLQAMLEDMGGSPKTPEGRRRLLLHMSELSPPARLSDSFSLSESGEDGTRKGSHRSPGYRRRGLRSSRPAANSGLEDSIAFEELLEPDAMLKGGKGHHDSSTSMITDSSHSFKSSQSFMSSRHYVKALDDNRKLLRELEEINRNYREQSTHLQRLEAYVEQLQTEQNENEEDVGADDEDSCSSSTDTMDLSHVSEGDECTATTSSTCTGPMPRNKARGMVYDDILRLSNHGHQESSQDIEFIPSPTSSAESHASDDDA